jgi:hypothetical protein
MATGNDNHRRSRTQFALGQVMMTPGAAAAFAATGEHPFPFLARHQQGDWGHVSPEDAAENAFSVAHGFRILSTYTLKDGTRIWILTEADRSATTILLPDEY